MIELYNLTVSYNVGTKLQFPLDHTVFPISRIIIDCLHVCGL